MNDDNQMPERVSESGAEFPSLDWSEEALATLRAAFATQWLSVPRYSIWRRLSPGLCSRILFFDEP